MPDAELHLPPDVRYVGLARMVVCAAARQEGMDEERVEDLRIAVSEATASAVVSRDGEYTDEPVVLQFGPRRGDFLVTVRDTGPWLATPPRERATEWAALASIPEPALAVTLVRGLADDVEVMPSDTGRVHMRFRLSLGPGIAPGPSSAEAGDRAEAIWPGQAEASA